MAIEVFNRFEHKYLYEKHFRKDKNNRMVYTGYGNCFINRICADEFGKY